jgi:NADP-dependent 3-hydroxy acid dehydrogenase YdfG
MSSFGRIDIVVNNAGMAALDTIHDMRSDVLDAVIDTNLKGRCGWPSTPWAR